MRGVGRHPTAPTFDPTASICPASPAKLLTVVHTLRAGLPSSMTDDCRGGGVFEVVGQVDNTDLAEDHLHVGEVLPSGEMDPRHAFHLLRSVCSRQLLILSSHGAFAVL